MRTDLFGETIAVVVLLAGTYPTSAGGSDCNGDGFDDLQQIAAGQLPDYNGNSIPDCCEWGGPCHVDAYPVQWRIADGGNGHWYMVVPESGSWSDGAAHSASVGAHMFTSNNLYEWDWVMANIMYECAGCKVWVGAAQDPAGAEPAGGWGWYTGETPFSVQWYTPGPGDSGGNADCGAVKSTGSYKGLSDQLCGNSYHFIAEWDADCNGDGIVDVGQILDGTFADSNANGVPDICDLRPGKWPENGHWYGTLQEGLNWEGGRAAAESLGGHLVMLTDAWEDEGFENIAFNPYGVSGEWWIGGFQADATSGHADGWEWVDGSPMTYTGWWPGYPNHPGISALAKKVNWGQLGENIDLDPSLIRYSAIEWEADCNGDGLVDFGQIYAGDLDDLNHNLVPDICECPGDVVLDGVVNGVDLAALLTAWGSTASGPADLNDDGMVDGQDLTTLLTAWGPCQ